MNSGLSDSQHRILLNMDCISQYCSDIIFPFPFSLRSVPYICPQSQTKNLPPNPQDSAMLQDQQIRKFVTALFREAGHTEIQ